MERTSVEITPSLIPTSPYSRASATRHDRWILFVNTYEPRPSYVYAVSWSKTFDNVKPN